MRSFIIRQRNRRMMNLAIRNGTYVPPTPAAAAGATATRHANTRVDLSKKPQLWEANLGGGGGGGWQQQPGSFGLNWKSEYSRDWESIKPIYAGYTETSVPHSGSTPTNLTGVSPPPISTPLNPSGRSRRDGDEENRGRTTASTTPSSLFTRARLFLNPNPTTTILGSSSSSSADNGTNLNSHPISTNTVTATTGISMTELSSSDPHPKIRVAVLIAMPSPLSTHGSSSSTTTPPSSKSQPTSNSESHPLELSSSPIISLKVADEEKLELKKEEPFTLPHLEMGVADVQVVLGRSRKDSESSSSRSLREEEKISSSIIHSRGSSYAE